MNIPAPQTTAQDTWKTWLGANWKALLGALLVGLLPFLPTLLSGQIFFASDQMNAPGAKWFFDALRDGELPLWSPLVYGGMPTFDAMTGDATYPVFVLLGFLLPITHLITLDFMLHLVIAGAGAYVLLQRYFRLDRWLAAVLSVAYMLNTNFISHIYSGHTAKFFILSWLPLSLYCLLRALGPRASWKHLLGLALSVALFISTSHLQFTYYVLMGYFLVWLYFLFPALKSKQAGLAVSLVLRFWVPVLLGVGLVFFLLYPPIQYNKDFSVRGAGTRITYEYATSWSMHPEEAASLIVPEFGGINENYWGRNYFKLNSEYPGLLIWFLGLLGLFAFRTRWFWFWGSVGVLSLLFGLGAETPFFHLFYLLPGMKNFRAPSMILFWLTAALLLMSAETLRRLTLAGEGSLPDERRKKILTRLRITGFSIAGVLAVCGIFPDLAFSIWNGIVDISQIPNFARQEMAKSAFATGALRAAVLTGVLTWATAAFLLKSRRPMAFGLAALAVTVVDLYWVDANFIKGMPAEQTVHYDPALDLLKADTSQYRVFGLPGAFEGLNMTYYGFETVDGRADNELRHYRAYRGDDFQNNPTFIAGLRQNPDTTVSGSPFLDLLNVKYLAFRVPQDPGLKLVRNASALPRAFFVPAWEAVSDSDALRNMKAPGFNPRRLVYVTAPGAVSGGVPGDSAAQVIPAAETLKKINRQVYRVNAPSAGVLVTSDIWFPFWRVTVDGVEAPLLRADFAFRGVLLTPGTHEVEFTYSSPWLRRGLVVSGVSLMLLILGSFLVRRMNAAEAVKTKLS